MSDRNIEQFVKSALEGNQDAFNELYHTNVNRAYFQALMLSRNDDIAAESVQLAFIDAFSKLHQLEDHSKFSSWLIKIVRGNTIDLLRKRKLLLFNDLFDSDEEFDFEDASIEFSPEASFNKKEYNRIVREIVESLPVEQRVCVLMFYFDEMKISEIATELAVSENTVKSRIRYGKEKIKSIVLDKEKQGLKLYSFGPVLFFIGAIREYAASFALDAEQIKVILHAINSSVLILVKMPKPVFKPKKKNNLLKTQIVSVATVVAVATGFITVFSNINDYNNMINDSITQRPENVAKQVKHSETIETEVIPFEVKYINDSSIDKGVQIVKQEGTNGVRTKTMKTTFVNSEIRDQVVISNEVTTQAIDKIILVGTKEKLIIDPVEPEPIIYTFTYNFDSKLWGLFETEEIAKDAVNKYKLDNYEMGIHEYITTTQIIRSDGQRLVAYRVILHDMEHKEVTSEYLPKGITTVFLEEGVWKWKEDTEVPIEYTYSHEFDPDTWGVYESIAVARNAEKEFKDSHPEMEVLSSINATKITRSDGKLIDAYYIIFRDVNLNPIPAENIPKGLVQVRLVNGQWKWIGEPDPIEYTFTYNFNNGIWGLYETLEIARQKRDEYQKNNPGMAVSTTISGSSVKRSDGKSVVAYSLYLRDIKGNPIINEETHFGLCQVELEDNQWRCKY